jgi:hypothetical protein
MNRLLVVFFAVCLSCCSDLGNDYDHAVAAKFWAEHEARSASLNADAAKLPIDQQYAVYRYGTEYFRPGRFTYEPLVSSGSRAVPLIRSKLTQLDDSWSIWTVAVMLEAMDGRTYKVAADAGLSADLWAAAERARGPYAADIKEIAGRIAPRT